MRIRFECDLVIVAVRALGAALLAVAAVALPTPADAAVQAQAAASSAQSKVTPYPAQRTSSKAKNFYASRWGIEDLRVRSTNAGNLIRFSFRVNDPALAQVLNDKRHTPAMVGLRSRVVLQVPTMDKVGTLRQAMPPEAGREYWMVFSNKGNFVRRGDRVDVLIGSFHADGLMVE